ncbi:MAG: hypothetical protein WDN29_05455 [Methylovirgula sp.]
MSLALGGANVVHAALARGALAANFMSQCRRLELYLSPPLAEAVERAESALSTTVDESMG